MKKYSDYFKYLIFFLILLPTNYLVSHYVVQTSMNMLSILSSSIITTCLFLFLQIYPNQRNINKYTCLTITHFSDQKSL